MRLPRFGASGRPRYIPPRDEFPASASVGVGDSSALLVEREVAATDALIVALRQLVVLQGELLDEQAVSILSLSAQIAEVSPEVSW